MKLKKKKMEAPSERTIVAEIHEFSNVTEIASGHFGVAFIAKWENKTVVLKVFFFFLFKFFFSSLSLSPSLLFVRNFEKKKKKEGWRKKKKHKKK